MTKNNIFKGLGVALATPFHFNGEVDYEALEHLINYQIDGGVDYLCVLGTTSESPCLSHDEKREIKNFVIKAVGGRVPILLGCGSNNTADVVRFVKEEDLAGVDGLLVVCPYYNKPSQEGMYRHFKTIAQATRLPLVLYNVPGRTGVNMQAETTLRLAQIDNIVAIKEASGIIAQVQDILEGAPEGFEVISGDDGITFELITMGATGVISVIGNGMPQEFGCMVHKALAGEINEALPIHRKLNRMFKLMMREGSPAGIKSLLSALGLAKNVLRLPLVEVSEETNEAIRNTLAAIRTK